jgi:hypothetical protein
MFDRFRPPSRNREVREARQDSAKKVISWSGNTEKLFAVFASSRFNRRGWEESF